MKRIYHLTLMQKLYLIPLKLIWLIYPNKNKKTWHKSKKEWKIIVTDIHYCFSVKANFIFYANMKDAVIMWMQT